MTTKYKLMKLSESNKIREKHKLTPKGVVEIYNPETGELLFKKTNKVIISGAAFTARAHFDLPRTEITPSYNTALNLENTVVETPSSLERVYLFAVGVDGCGAQPSQIYPVDYKHWINPADLVPFRYQLDTNDISNSLREIYFGRKVINDRIAYYFKALDSEPKFIQQYLDGTPIDGTVYESTKVDEAESYVQLKMKITKDDCRDYFKATTGISDANISSISLLTCWSKEIDGLKYYQDIRPLTKLHISKEPLVDLTKGLDIVYHLYY